MEDIIKVKKEDIVSLAEEQKISDLIKPLTREIYLFDSFVAGTAFLSDPSVLDEVKAGDKLSMQREDNRFDSNAIVLLTQDKRKVGYIPEKDNVVFARLMDAGKLLTAKVKTTEMRGSFHQISIGIYLIDF